MVLLVFIPSNILPVKDFLGLTPSIYFLLIYYPISPRMMHQLKRLDTLSHDASIFLIISTVSIINLKLMLPFLLLLPDNLMAGLISARIVPAHISQRHHRSHFPPLVVPSLSRSLHKIPVGMTGQFRPLKLVAASAQAQDTAAHSVFNNSQPTKGFIW